MARYPSSRRGRQRSRRWVYIISALVIVAVVVVFGYRRNKGEVAAGPTDSVPENETKLPVLVAAEPEPEPALLEIALEPTAKPNPQAAELIAEAMAMVNAKPARIIEARDRLNEVLPMPMSEPQRAVVKKQLSELADKWLFSRTIFPQDRLCGTYKVKPGDQLRTIGVQYKVPYEILMDINKISSPQSLQAGAVIKVINGPFHARVYRSAFTLDLYLQNTFVRSFPVGLGKLDMETPTGLWVVRPDSKLIKPTWTDPVSGRTYEAESPDYPLGSRWIGLEGIRGDAKGRTGFGIHGTKSPDQIGSASSQGCIRLHNGDAILIYNLLMPGSSQVEIVE